MKFIMDIMLSRYIKQLKGFTIVELLVVMAVLAILLTITIVAINPTDQLAKSRDTKRKANVEAIANAIHQYSVEKQGALPPGMTETPAFISSNELDLCPLLVPNYISALPQDPDSNNGVPIKSENCGNYNSGYTVRMMEDTHFVVEAPGAERNQAISETR